MRLAIRQVTATEFLASSNLAELLNEYAGESSIPGIHRHNLETNTYLALEAAGAISVFGAYQDDLMVGFVAVLTTVLPHYGSQISTTESYFVSKAHRKSGAGIKLLRKAEQVAKDRGSIALMVSAPTGGVLAKVLPRVGFTETNQVFFKNLAQETGA